MSFLRTTLDELTPELRNWNAHRGNPLREIGPGCWAAEGLLLTITQPALKIVAVEIERLGPAWNAPETRELAEWLSECLSQFPQAASWDVPRGSTAVDRDALKAETARLDAMSKEEQRAYFQRKQEEALAARVASTPEAAARAWLASHYPEARPQLPVTLSAPAAQGERGPGAPALDWLPKKAETLERWHAAYEIICTMRQEKREVDAWGDDPKPTLADYRDRLGEKMDWRPSVKTVGRIIQAGDKGYLAG